MELGLRLGDASSPFDYAEKPREPTVSRRGLDFCLGFSSICRVEEEDDDEEETHHQRRKELAGEDDGDRRPCVAMADADDDSPLQLDLLPRTPFRRNSSRRPSSETDTSEAGSFPATAEPAAVGGGESPRNAVFSSSFELIKYGGGGNSGGVGSFFRPENVGGGIELDDGGERGCSRTSDDDDQNIGSASRKKLRLSREQSAFLEESFKEHHTLYPKQKLELARRLNLRPRQVEVWFQNRRARTKLKQTEVDCEYLKKCCETLTVENRKLQKELQDLRALKTTDSLFMHLPATTLTMCPSCERVAAAAAATSAAAAAMHSGKEPMSKASAFPFATPTSNSYPFP